MRQRPDPPDAQAAPVVNDQVEISLRDGTRITMRRGEQGLELCHERGDPEEDVCLSLPATAPEFLALMEFFQDFSGGIMTTQVKEDRLRVCIARCLRRPDPTEKETREAVEEEVVARRTEKGLTKAPAMTGFTTANINRCVELYTLTELQDIAERNGVRTTGSALTLCARLLHQGLLSSQRTQQKRKTS